VSEHECEWQAIPGGVGEACIGCLIEDREQRVAKIQDLESKLSSVLTQLAENMVRVEWERRLDAIKKLCDEDDHFSPGELALADRVLAIFEPVVENRVPETTATKDYADFREGPE
jgi:hypothetical protein